MDERTGENHEAPAAPTVIEVKPDGPLLVTGDFTIIGPDGEPIEVVGDRAKLCRCGRSATKPFCDATHKRDGWSADVAG